MVEFRLMGLATTVFGVEEEEGYDVGGVDESMEVEAAETGVNSFDLKGEGRWCTFDDVGDEENLLLLSLLVLLFSFIPPSSVLALLFPDRLFFFADGFSLNQPPITPHHPTNTLSISSSFSTSTLATPATVGSFSHSRRRESDSAISESR